MNRRTQAWVRRIMEWTMYALLGLLAGFWVTQILWGLP